jgi:hypothetical protein
VTCGFTAIWMTIVVSCLASATAVRKRPLEALILLIALRRETRKPGTDLFYAFFACFPRGTSRIASLCYLRLHHEGLWLAALPSALRQQKPGSDLRAYAIIHYLCELAMAKQ